MKFDDLFEQRVLVGSKLKDCIRDRGYTKVAFAGKTGISRPTLDKLLSGTINSKSSFDRHLQKILKTLDMSVDGLMLFHSSLQKKNLAVFSQNAPAEHEMSMTARKQYDLLLDIVDLCTIYY